MNAYGRRGWRPLVMGIAAAVLSQVVAPALGAAATFADSRAAHPQPQTIARMRVGAGRGEVGVEEGAEEAWGASSFAVAPDGAFYIVDGVNDKLIVLEPDGGLRREIPLPAPLIAPEDIAVTPAGVYLMDVAAQPGVVCRLAEDGTIARSWPVPEEHSQHAVTGIDVQSEQGEDVFLELDGSWTVPLVADGAAARPRPLPLVKRGNRADVPATDAPGFGLRGRRRDVSYNTVANWDGGVTGKVQVFERGTKARELPVRARGELLGLKALDSAGPRDFVLMSQFDEAGDTETRVMSFLGGEVESSFRIPKERQATTPDKGVRIGGAGEVYCMVTGADEVTIERLPAESPVFADAAPQPVAAAKRASRVPRWLASAWDRVSRVFRTEKAYAVWSRLNAYELAYSYVNQRWYCSKVNFLRSCDDYRPAYIDYYGKTFTSVPYCWGGGDMPSQFVANLAAGMDAGDVRCEGTKRWCTAGVDCSGLVSRMWGLTKHGSAQLLDHSYKVDWSTMQTGDAYIWPDRHVIAFNYYTNGQDAVVWESTTDSDKDRVIANIRTEGYLRDAKRSYTPQRYNNW